MGNKPKKTAKDIKGKPVPKVYPKLTVNEFRDLLREYGGVNGALLKRLVQLEVLDDEEEEFNPS